MGGNRFPTTLRSMGMRVTSSTRLPLVLQHEPGCESSGMERGRIWLMADRCLPIADR
jgi:hypothetical protein